MIRSVPESSEHNQRHKPFLVDKHCRLKSWRWDLHVQRAESCDLYAELQTLGAVLLMVTETLEKPNAMARCLSKSKSWVSTSTSKVAAAQVARCHTHPTPGTWCPAVELSLLHLCVLEISTLLALPGCWGDDFPLPFTGLKPPRPRLFLLS
jgi:hypothetical protein